MHNNFLSLYSGPELMIWKINAVSFFRGGCRYTPASGEIVEINEKIVDSPELINKDPYGEGWFVKIKLKDKAELDSLMDKEEYDKLVISG